MTDVAEIIAVRRLPAIPALTGVRFFAAFAVLLFHYGATFAERSGIPIPIAQVLHNGYLGVSLFFILSGFILTYTHQNDRLDGRFLSGFYMARFARVYPVYIVALLLALPVLSAPLTTMNVATVLVMLQSWASPQSSAGYLWVMQAWTLSVELFFYLFFPAILLCARRLNALGTGLVAAAAAGLIVLFGLSSIVPGTTDIPFMSSSLLPLPLLRTVEFVYGVMLCRLTVFYPNLSRRIGGNWAELLLTAAIVIIMAFATDVHSKALVTVLAGALILQLVRGTGSVSSLLSSKPLILLGGASYAIYLIQGPIRALCDHFIPHPLDRFASPLITVVGAIAVFLLWEQPCRRLLLTAYKTIRLRAVREGSVDGAGSSLN